MPRPASQGLRPSSQDRPSLSQKHSHNEFTLVEPPPYLHGETYQCPGEAHSISRSIHLARLAAGFPACRDCRFRNDTGCLPEQVVRPALGHSTARRPRPLGELVNQPGLRGVYINELTRSSLALATGAFLRIVDGERLPQRAQRGLRVLVGHDFRSSSPDLVMGVVETLLRNGCEIADVGRSTRPIFDFAAAQLGPDAGLFVTGGSEAEPVNGLDFIDARGWNWLHPQRRESLLEAAQRAPSRLSRQAGIYQSVAFVAAYEAAIESQLHALRPLRVGLDCEEPLHNRRIEHALSHSPCTVQSFETEGRVRLRSTADFSEFIAGQHLDIGFRVARDARRCDVFNECGEPIDTLSLVRFLNQLSDGPLRTVHEKTDRVPLAAEPFADCLVADEQTLSDRFPEIKSPVVGDRAGHVWFLREVPRCDALLTIARMLEAASYSDLPLSLQLAAGSTIL